MTGQLFDDRPMPAFLVEQRAVLDAPAVAAVDALCAALRVWGFQAGPGGDPHMMGHRAPRMAEFVAEVLDEHGLSVSRTPTVQLTLELVEALAGHEHAGTYVTQPVRTARGLVMVAMSQDEQARVRAALDPNRLSPPPPRWKDHGHG